ncbi:hypothetical protein SBOR_2174 [Sclerotinia borealis F-4128]|uniref:Involucrin repeat protein n=1 Tax=Sclerotinia borealis (strain F-4128) TaxID=1432307 RepID=W9CSL1_SCLBF|nr:hypothetical protein SBOR_2174 [Sclerotinia borealis F-4128]
MAENRDRYGMGGDPSIAPRGNGNGSGNGNGGRGYNGRAPPNLGFGRGESLIPGRGRNDERFDSRPPNTPMTPYTPYTPVTMGYDGGESSISAGTPRQDRYYGEESALGGRPAVTPGTAGYDGGESSFNVGTPRTERYDGRESYIEGRTPRTGRYEAAESIMSIDTPRTERFDPGIESSIAHPDTPRTAHYDTTATTMSMDPSRTGPYDKDNTITVAEYYDPERAREHERQMMEREKLEREQGMRRPSGMEYGPPSAQYLSTSGSSTSSYLDISRNFPTIGFGFKSFFSTPSEKSDSKRKKEKKKKSKKLTKHNSSSSSSLNEDLAFGTGFLRYRRKRSVRARDGRDRQWETVGYKSSKENLKDTRSAISERPTSARRPTTDAEILAVGAGLAKLARDQNKKDLKNAKNGRDVPETVISSSRGDDRGLPPSRIIPYETDPNDDENWESASDGESDSSVDSGLAFGSSGHVGKSHVGFFGRKKMHEPKSRKSSVVDPRLLGPENSLNGYLSDRPVGFEDVRWESGSDFGQHTYTPYHHEDRHVSDVYVHEKDRMDRTQSVASDSQASLQQVFPVPTNDHFRFEAARVSSSEYKAPRPAPVVIQQPQPITPVSQSVYHEPNYVRSESGGILKSSSGRSKSLAGVALAGVAAVGAVIASNRRDENEYTRDDDKRDHRSYSESAVSRRDKDPKEKRDDNDQYSVADRSITKPREEDRRDGRRAIESMVSQRDDDRKEQRRDEDQYSIADSSISKPRDDDRKEQHRDYDQSSIADSNLTWDQKREKRREERRKDDSKSSTSSSDRDQNRDKSRDDPDAATQERERRRRERREERRAPDRAEDNYDERRAHVLSEISAITHAPTDPFLYQVADTPPHEESSGRPKEESVPSVVTVEREPDFTRKRSSSIKEPSSVARSEPRIDVSDKDDKEKRYRDSARALHDAEMIYEETEHSTAPIAAAAIAAAAAAVAREGLRESRSAKRRGERQSDPENSTKAPEKSHGDVMEEADRAYREIVMARKVAAEVRRSRTPSPERSVINKYEEESEEEAPHIVTPPSMHERKKGPYDAPNADFKLDYIMTPKDLRVYSIPALRYKVDQADLMGPFMTKDADARFSRPLLNLIRPTPTSTPSPEKQFATAKNGNGKTISSSRPDNRSMERSRSEPERSSKTSDRDEVREQTSARSQIEPTRPKDINQGREQAPSYRSQDEPRKRTQTREQAPSYRPQDEPMDRTQTREQAPSYRSQDEPRERAQTREQAPSYRPQDKPTQPRERIQDREQTSSYRPQDEPRDKTQAREQTPLYRSEEEPRDQDRRKRSTRDIPPIVVGPRGDLVRSSDVSAPSPTQSTVSKAVTWGPNETKHFEVESPTEHKDDFISDSFPEVPEKRRHSEPRSEPNSEPIPASGWASMTAGILGAGVGAAVAGSAESSRQPEVSEIPRSSKSKDLERDERNYGYRGVVVEPESPYGESRRESPPRETRRDSLPQAIIEPENPRKELRRESPPRDTRREILPQDTRRHSPPQDTRRERLPQNTRRDSPPSIGPKPASLQSSHMPGSFDDDLDFTATVAAGLQDTGFNPDLVIDNLAFRKRDSPPGSNEYKYKTPWAESITDLSSVPGESSSNRGVAMGEVPEPPKDWTSTSPANEESPKLTKKEQRKRGDKDWRRSGAGVSSTIADVIVEEPESYFDSSTQSREEQERGDNEVARPQSLLREESSFVDISPAHELVEEPESYVEADEIPKKFNKKLSRSSTYDGNVFDSSVSMPKRNSGKRSLTYDDKAPLRGSHRTFSLDDIKNDDESRAPGEFKRDSGRFGSPDPSQISLPDSDNIDEDLDRPREPEKLSRRDDDDPRLASSRSILSGGSSKLDEEDSPRKNRKDRSSTKDGKDGKTLVSSEPIRDENEDSKKKAKGTPKKGSGLFGFFGGAKTDATKGDLAKEIRDDTDDAKKKKKKRSSTSDGISGGAQEFGKDGEKKRSKSSDSKKDSFLDNAGTLGAGVGLAAGAIAISAQHQQQTAANNNDSEGTRGESGERGERGERGEQDREEEIFDPEIIERQIRPSIDPQYGDLLPLPPSGSVSPNFEPIDDLPKLPESRPATPVSEKRSVGTPREKTSRNRKSLQETPVKSPSQSAVPLKFVMGNRSNPASPILTRSTGNTPFPAFQPSPIAESAIIARSRSRPMSWDNTKEFKPLYLLETNRRGSFVPEELIEPLPHLPPSRTNSELDVADLPELGSLEKLDLHRLSLDPLSTNLPSEDLVSGESTPTAITFKRDLAPSVEFLQDSFPSVEEKTILPSNVHSHERSSSDSKAQAIGSAVIVTAAGLAIASHDTSGNDNFMYSSESHDLSAEREKTLQTLSATLYKQAMSIEEEVESTEDFPLSKSKKNKKGKGLMLASDDINDQTENTPEPIQEFEPLSTPIEAEHVEPGKATFREPESELQSETPGQEDTQELKPDDFSSEQHTVTEPSRDLFEEVAIPIEIEPVEEFSAPKSKKNKRKVKNALFFEPELETETVDNLETFKPMDGSTSADKSVDQQQQQVPESSHDIVEESLPSVEIDPVEEFSVPKFKKDKKKDKKQATTAGSKPHELTPEPVVETTTERPIRKPSIEKSTELPRGFSDPSSSLVNLEVQPVNDSSILETPGDITPTAYELTSPKSRKDTKKSKKAKSIFHDPEPEQAMIEPNFDEPVVSQSQEVTRDNPLEFSQASVKDDIQRPTTPANVEPIEEFSTPKSGKDKNNDKQQAKEEQDMDTERESIDAAAQEQVPDIQEKDFVHIPILEETPKLDDVPESITSPSSKKSKTKSKKGKAADVEEPAKLPVASPLPIPETVSEKPTPMVGPGGWPVTPATPWTSVSRDASKSNAENYFPVVETTSPDITAGAAVLGAEQLNIDQSSQDKNVSDSFVAEYDNDQFVFAKQPQEGFTDGDNRSRNDKKKRQSQTITPERSRSRSKSTERSNFEHNEIPNEPLKPQQVAEDNPKGLVEGVAKLDELPAGYEEDQPTIARQLAVEFGNESGTDTKHRSVSQTLQKERGQFFHATEQIPADEPHNEERSIVTETGAQSGLDISYKDDQPALAKQLKDGFESGPSKVKKSDKGKERAGQNQDDELPSDISPSDNVAKNLNEQADVLTSQLEIIEGPTNKAVIEEPKELPQTEDKSKDKYRQQQSLDESALGNNVITESTPLEETLILTQAPDTVQDLLVDPIITESPMVEKKPIDPVITESQMVERAPIDPTITEPEPEVLTPSKKSKKQKKRDSLPASIPSEKSKTPKVLETTKPVDVPERFESEYSYLFEKAYTAVDPKAELGTPDKNQDGLIEPIPLEEDFLSSNVDDANSEEVKSDEAKASNNKQEIPATPLESPTMDREIEFSTPPKKSKKDKKMRGKQVQDSIEEDVASKDITPASESSNIETPVGFPSSAPIEQIITIPAKESTPNDAPSTPMTAGLSGLMGPLTGRKKGVLEMVQALGWGKKKDKAAIAAAEKDLPPRPSTARAASVSSMPKVIEAEPVVAPTPTEKLEEWALPNRNSTEKLKGKDVVSADPEPAQDIVVEEPLPIESKEDTTEQTVEPPVTKPIEEVQDDTSSKRPKGKKRHSLQSFLSGEASKAFRFKDSANKEPETPSLTAEPAFNEQSREIISEPNLETPVEERKEPDSVLEVPTRKSKKDEKKRQSLQSLVSEEMPKEELDVSRDAFIEEPKSQTPENGKTIVESSSEPLEIPRELVEGVQSLEAPFEHVSEPIVERSIEPEELRREIDQEEVSAPQLQREHILMPIVEKSSKPEEISREVVEEDVSAPQRQPPLEQTPKPIIEQASEPLKILHEIIQEQVLTPEYIPEPIIERSSEITEIPRQTIQEAPLEHISEPMIERFDESSETPREVIQEHVSAPQALFEHVTESRNEASLPSELNLREATKSNEDVEPSMVDESSMSKETIPEDIMPSVEYVEPSAILQESFLPQEPLPENNVEVINTNTVDDLSLQRDATPQEDSREIEIVEPSDSVEGSILLREPLLQESSKAVDRSLPTQATPQEDSRDAESFEPSHTVEETFVPTAPAEKIQTTEPVSSEIPIIEKPETRDETILPGTKKSRKSKKNKSKDKSESEPQASTEVIQEPEQTPFVEEPTLEKRFETAQSTNRDILEQPAEQFTETVEPTNHEVLEPASVPLPEDLVDEFLELDEPANVDVIIPSLEHATSNPISEETIVNPEVEEPNSRENSDYLEHAASIPLPEDTFEKLAEHSEPENSGVLDPRVPASEIVEQTIESPSADVEVPANREISEPVSPNVVEKSAQQPAPISPKRSRKDKRKSKSAISMPLIEDSSLSLSPLHETETRAIEPVLKQVPQLPDVPVTGPLNEMIFNEPQAIEATPADFNPKTAQKAIEAAELITTPSFPETTEPILQDNLPEPLDEVPTKRPKKDKKKRKSQLPVPLAEDTTTQAPLESSPTQQADDIPTQASLQDPTESIPVAKQTITESIVNPTLKDAEAKQANAKATSQNPSEDQQPIKSVSKDITDSPETNFTDAPIKVSKNGKKKRISLVTNPTDEPPTESMSEITETSQSIVQPPAEEFHHDMVPEEIIEEIAPEPITLQDPIFEPKPVEEESSTPQKPAIESKTSEPQMIIPQEPTIEPEIVEEASMLQEIIAPLDSSIESRTTNEDSFLSRETVIKPDTVKEEVLIPQNSRIESRINEEPFLSKEPIIEPEITKEETFIPDEPIVESTTSQTQLNTPQDRFVEPEMTKESFVPQESTIRSRINEERPTFHQELQTAPKVSDPGVSLAQDSIHEPINSEEQLVIRKPVLEVNIPEPEQIALPDSPIEQKSFILQVPFRQEPVVEPQYVALPNSPIEHKKFQPEVLSRQEPLFEPEHIALPESPMEQKSFELGVPFLQEPVVEPQYIALPESPIEHKGFQPEVLLKEHKSFELGVPFLQEPVVEPVPIDALPKLPIEQNYFELKMPCLNKSAIGPENIEEIPTFQEHATHIQSPNLGLAVPRELSLGQKLVGPEQITLPESPIEQEVSVLKVPFQQEPVFESRNSEEPLVSQERSTDSKRPDLELIVPHRFAEPEQIALPESPIEDKAFEPETPFRQEPIFEPKERSTDSKNSDLESFVPRELPSVHKIAEPEEIALSKSPFEQKEFQPTVLFRQEPVVKSNEHSTDSKNSDLESIVPLELLLGHKTAEPEEIALPESPIEDKAFEPEIPFRQEPIAESKERPIDNTLPDPEPSASQKLPLEQKVAEREAVIPQHSTESTIAEELPVFHERAIGSKISELEPTISRELPIEQSFIEAQEFNVKEPVLESKNTEETTAPQESSLESKILKQETTIPRTFYEEANDDFEPVSHKKSRKDKKKRKKNLDLSETSEEPIKFASTSRTPELENSAIAPEPTSLDPIIIEPTSSSQPTVSQHFEPIASVEPILSHTLESTSITEPITHEKATNPALRTEPFTSELAESVHSQPPIESLPIETESARRNEQAWPAEESKEDENKGEGVFRSIEEASHVAPQAEQSEKSSFEIMESQSTEDNAKDPVQEVLEETPQDSFSDAVEYFPTEEIATEPTPEVLRELIMTLEPGLQDITQNSAEQSTPEVIKSLRDEESATSPIPEAVHRQIENVIPGSEEITQDELKAMPEIPQVNLQREMLIEERTKEEHRPAEDDVTEVSTKYFKDTKDREFGFSSPVQFVPKNTQLGVPGVVKSVPALNEIKAMPTGEMPKEVQQQTEDEWGSVSTKKSKKDKKKRKSILSTPLIPEVLNVATELPEDTLSNPGKPEELHPTIDNDVPDTHTSFQIPQVETIIRGDDLFSMPDDNRGKERSSREFDPESQTPIAPNTVAVSETQDVKPGERLFALPIPMRNTVQTSEPIVEPDTILPAPLSSSPNSIIDEPDKLSSDLSRTGSKQEKRKRQNTENLDTPRDDQRTFWAGEVPEAEIIRPVPVIEDIGRDEFYSHIASTVEKPQTNEFSRPPAKKGKKDTKRESAHIELFRQPMGEDLSQNESMKERKEMPSVVAANAAIVSAAFVANKSKEPGVDRVKEEESSPVEGYLEQEEIRQSIDNRVLDNDVFDNSVIWEDKDPKVFVETKDEFGEIKNDGYASDGFEEEHTIVQEPEQMANTQEPMIEMPGKFAAAEPREIRTPTPRSPVGIAKFVQEPEQTGKSQEWTAVTNTSAITEAREIRTPRSLSPVLNDAEFVQEPEQMETTQEKVIVETPAEPETAKRNILHEPEQMETVQESIVQIPVEPMIVERKIVQEPEQMEIPRESMDQIPAKPLVMEARETRTPTTPRKIIYDDDRHLESETVPATTSSSPSPRRSPPAREPRGDLPEPYLSRPSRREMEKKKKQQAEADNTQDLLPTPIQEALRNVIASPQARDISPSPVSSPKAERAKRARSRSRPPSRPGTPGLTILQEESEEEHALNVDNRDSAFVSDSPNPQGNFTEKHEHVRDSGIHLRDNSPSMRVRAPVSSTDAAIESMAWPSVDEDAGTVDLKQPQRFKIVERLKRHDHGIDDLPSQRHREEKHTDLQRTSAIHGVHSPREEKHRLARKTSLSRGELAEANHVDFVRSQRLKAFETKSKEKLSEPHQAEPINKFVTPEREHTRHRVHRSDLPDLQYRKPKEKKYGDLEPVKTPKTEQRSISENSPSLFGGAALAAAGLGFAEARKSSQENRPSSAQSHKRQKSASNISVTRLRTPVPSDAPQPPQFPDCANTNRSFTPPLRRVARKISGDLRSLRQQSNTDLAKEIVPASVDTATSTISTNTANPTANEGRARAQEMADVYDGYGEGRMGSPRSPTRPHSMRRRQSMQVLELESKLDQLAAENRTLAESKAHAEHMLRSSQGAPAALVERDAQIDLLKRTLASMQDEVKRLTEVNTGLSSAAVTLGQQYNARYGTLESQHAQTSRELQQALEAHHNLQSEVEGIIHNSIQERDQEIESLRSQLDAAKEQIRAMQREILAAKASDTQFLIIRDEDYFDNACQQLCQHVQQWVLRFSKFSDMRACRLTSEINNDKTIDRLDNAILDGSDVDSYLADRVRRRDVFMSMTMTMVWEFIFTRYLFGMDREQRQKLKSLEKVLSEVGPPSAVHQWRATTLTLLSKRESFARQKDQDTLAVVHAVLETLTEILPPPSHLEGQIEEQLKRVMKAAVDLSIEMRTQRAEYMMLPPLQPEYDANGDLASKVSFNAALMNERSGDTISNEELEAQKAVVRVVLFPLVVKKGDDLGQGDEEIVVCPAQVLVAKPRMGKGPVGRVYSPASGMDMDRRSDRSRTPASMQSSMPDTNVI